MLLKFNSQSYPQMYPQQIPIYYTNAALKDSATELACLTGGKITDCLPLDEYYLMLQNDKLSIHLNNNQQAISFYVDFDDHEHQQLLQTTGKKSNFAKALGLHKYQQPLVILDATAGFGKDSLIMAKLGCHVMLCEQNPIVFALLANGHHRMSDAVIKQRMQLHQDDSTNFIKKLSADQAPDIIYLDLMFPESKKSRLVKKNMQILQKLDTQTFDQQQLLLSAINTANKRVIVKRPKGSAHLCEKVPDIIYGAKASIRFDVYTCAT